MLGLVRHQLRYDLKRFFRDPQAVAFTVALPVIFLIVFAAVFGNQRLDARDGLRIATYYVPGIMALGVMPAAFVGLAIGLVEARERGMLKRVRATPMPAGASAAWALRWPGSSTRPTPPRRWRTWSCSRCR